MGISAVNSIHENGEILYDGQDLMRIPEEEMHKLRGDKIAMIFQDPLSSLNPIMRIGRQITEAMLLKNKANRKEGRVTFNKQLSALSNMMVEALAEKLDGRAPLRLIDSYIKTFDDFNICANKLQNSYNAARTATEELIAIVEDFLFLAEKKQKIDVVSTLNLVERKLKDIDDKYFAAKYMETIQAYLSTLAGVQKIEKAKVSIVESVKQVVTMSVTQKEASPETVALLEKVRETAKEMLEQPEYNLFRIGYYVYKAPKKKNI
jgi:oligopeptide transport system ATP-binding protein